MRLDQFTVKAQEAITSAWSDDRPPCSVLVWKCPPDLPDDDTAGLFAVEGEDDVREGYFAGGQWFFSDSGIEIEKPVTGTVYAWADLPAAPKKGAA